MRSEASGIRADRWMGGVVSLLAVLAAAPLAGATIRVAPAPAGSDANDGLSWATPKLLNRNAILAAGNDGEVIVSNGTYTLSAAIPVERTVTVRSLTGQAGDVRIDGNKAVSCLNVTAAATFEDLTITNALNNTSSGGAMYVNHSSGTAVFRRCVFAGNTGSFGAAGRVSRPTLFEQCLFLNNDGASAGGGICLGAGEMTDCLFTGNKGGGLKLEGALAKTITGCVFRNNTGSTGGGIVANASGAGAIVLRDCDIIGNSATSNGGGIYMLFSGTVIDNCRLIGNTVAATARGGGAYLNAQTVLTDCVITNNSAGSAGGLYIQGIAATNCVIASNSGSGAASTSGGGVLLDGSAAKVFVRCVFTNNTGVVNGGGIAHMGSSATPGNTVLRDCDISRNSASAIGGGIYLGTRGDFAENCRIVGNYAGSRGGGANVNGAGVFRDCSIVQNTCVGNGGGIYLQAGALTNCLVASNAATQSGGGVFFDTATVKTLAECTFSNNTAGVYGGAVGETTWSSARNRTLDRCSFVRNASANHGGAIYASASTLRNCLFAGNQSGGKGGALTLASSVSLIENCTIVQNRSTVANGGACYFDWGGSASLVNTILHGNTVLSGATVHFSGSGAAATTATHCSLTPQMTGAGNITGDPLFVAAGTGSGTALSGGDYRLTRPSGCVNHGASLAWMVPASTDLDGNARALGGAPDIGAYEFLPVIGGTVLTVR